MRPAKVSQLRLPEITWRKRHPLGEILFAAQPERLVPIDEINSIQISPRIKEQLVVLETGEKIVVTKRRRCPRPAEVEGVLFDDSNGGTSWISHRLLEVQGDPTEWAKARLEVTNSWSRGIRYAMERRDSKGNVTGAGLRPPQIGALHAIGAHWSLQKAPATIVMPTGTGKTETMIASLVSQAGKTLLVIVPSSPLRDQTTNKFRTLGLLRQLGVLPDDVRNPIVGILRKRPKAAKELDIFERCHVVISTMAALGQGTATKIAPAIAALVDGLVVDEAHHIAADTWREFREHFKEKRILQFTATPFRRDGKIVDGEVVYSYPLRRAQEDGYFKPITFYPVCEVDPDEADKAIAEKAIAQLAADIANGHDHLLMARCESIDRAAAVHAIYSGLGSKYKPVLVHSQDPASRGRLLDLRSGKSRIVVCVDMLGEGFDLPQLKVAAVHDTHKSIAVLLQFTGRFTRSAGNRVGNASVVANIADQNVSDALDRLYSEDADWNYLLAEMSSQAVKEHRELVEFLKQSVPIDTGKDAETRISISPSLLRPKFSAAVFRTAEFHPKQFFKAFSSTHQIHRVWVHNESRTLYFVTRMEPAVDWTRAKSIIDRQWDLYVVHHDAARGLLFIHSSDKSSLHDDLASAVGGAKTTLINGDPVFRTLANINRLRFQNIGITKHGRRNLRYAMYTGADVKQALDQAQTAGSTKSNLQGTGFEAGTPVSVGCSYKGRVWAKETGPIRKFLDWCHQVGAKLVDESLNTEKIIDNVMIPEEVDSFPVAQVLTIEWPIELLRQQEDRVLLRAATGDTSLSIVELAFDQVDPDRKNLRFHLEGPGWKAEYVFRLGVETGYAIERASGPNLSIAIGRLELPLEKYLSDWPPMVRFVDLSELDGNLLVRPQEAQALTFPAERFESWDWTDVDVTKESIWKGGVERLDSIQHKAAQKFQDGGFNLIFDDDGPGEAADLVCMKAEADHIRLALVHCKYTQNAGGARVKDVVEVSSQAVRSGRWMWNFKGLCRHVFARERRLRTPQRNTRFLVGDAKELNKFVQMSRFKEVRGEILIVQPGFSQGAQTQDQVSVLASAHSFLNETVGVGMDVICSA